MRSERLLQLDHGILTYMSYQTKKLPPPDLICAAERFLASWWVVSDAYPMTMQKSQWDDDEVSQESGKIEKGGECV